MNKILIFLAVIIATGCSDARVASHNISKASEQFEIDRRVIFYNGITGEYMLSISGKCSTEQTGTKVTVTCKTGPDEFKLHRLGLSDNVTYFVEQLKPAGASVYHYRVIFKPQTIVPDVDFKSSVTG